MQKICFSATVFSWFAMLGVTDHYLPWVSWHGEAMACVALFFLWLSLIFANSKIPKISMPRESYFFLAIGGVAGIQVFCMQLLFASDILLLGLNILLITLSICLGFYYTNNPPVGEYGGVGAFAAVILTSAFILAVQAMVRSFDIDFMSEWIAGVGAKRRPGSNLSQPNHLATFLNWGVICIAYLHFKNKVRLGLFYLAILPLAFGLVLAESRTGLLSFVCICVVLAFLRVEGRRPKLLEFLCIAVTTSICFVLWPELWASIQILGSGNASVNVSSSGRYELWLQTLQAIAVHPFAGWGYRQFAWAHMSVVAGFDSALVATYSHNLILDLVIWFGLPVGLILIVLMLRWIYIHASHLETTEQKMALLFLLPLGMHAMLEFPHVYLYFLIPLGLCIGALTALKGGLPKVQLPRRVFHGIYIFVFAFAFWTAYEYFQLEEDFRLARFASARVGSDPIDYQKSKIYLLYQISDLVDVVREIPAVGMAAADIERARRVALYYPWLGTLSKYAIILKLNGYDAEYDYYIKIIRIYFGEGAVLRLREKLEVLRAHQ